MPAIKRLFNTIDGGLILALLLSLFIIQSLLQPGLPTVADLPIHIYRTLEYRQAWAPGVVIPHWAPNLAYGYGYPLFIFAPPLPYLLGLAFQTTGLSLEAALKLLLMLTILLYAGGMYLLARQVTGSAAVALVAAAAYTFAPFALREILLYGGNLPQFLAIGLFPWTLWAMAAAARQRSWRRLVLAALFYAGILLSHLFQALIFTPVAALYGLLLFGHLFTGVGGTGQNNASVSPGSYNEERQGDGSPLPARGQRGARLLASLRPVWTIPLGLLLSAFFWLPAYTERFFTRAQANIYLEKSPFFVRYPQWTELVAWIQPLDLRAANPYVPLTLGPVTLGLAALGLLAGIGLHKLGRGKTAPPDGASSPGRLPSLAWSTLFFLAIAAVATFMTLSVSRPIWERISILQVAEFPWRMLGLANLGLAFLAGCALLLVPARQRWPAAVVCLVLQLMAVAPYLYPTIPFSRYDRVTLADQIDYERRSQSIGTTTLGEYLPRTVRRPPHSSPMVETFQAGQIPERLDRGSLPGGATATLLEQNAVTHRYQLDSPASFTLRLFQFDYPGWQATIDDDQTQALVVKPEPDTGLILVDMPAGRHTLTIHFSETPGRLAALALTGLTLLGLLWLGLVKRPATRPLSPDRPPATPGRSRLRLASPRVLLAAALVVGGALGLKPLLRPVFTFESPPHQALPAQVKTEIDFENGIRLIGYDISHRVAPAGGYLQVVLYWETKTAPLNTNLQPFVHLDRLDDLTTVADATNYTPGDPTTESNVPTFHWDNRRYVRDEHDFILPPDLPPQAYAVRAGLIDPGQGRLVPLADGSGDTAWLTTINVSPAPTRPVELARPLAVTFGRGSDTIRLVGFEPGPLAADRLNFTLAWQSDQTPQAAYTVFAQLLDQQGRQVAGFDQPPLAGAYPTSTWLPGQTIIDPRYIPLAGLPPGEYRLIVGLYDSATQARLVTAAGTDFVELTRVTLKPPGEVNSHP